MEQILTQFASDVQGTNAHLVLQGPGGETTDQVDLTSAWIRRRLWAVPRAHPMITAVASASKGTVTFEVALQQARLSELLDHIVLGRAVLPGAALFEAACAAVRLLSLQDGSPAGAANAALVSIVIPSPKYLEYSLPGGQESTPQGLCRVEVSGADLTIGSPRSSEAESEHSQVHLYAEIGRVQALALPLSSASSDRPNSRVFGSLGRLLEPMGDASAADMVPATGNLDYSGFSVYAIAPAALDSCFHLAGAFSAKAEPLKIPAGADALAIRPSSDRQHQFWAVAVPQQFESGPATLPGLIQPAVHSFSLVGPSAIASAAVQRLALKPMGAVRSTGRVSASKESLPAPASAQGPAPDCLYEITWPVAVPAPPAVPSSSALGLALRTQPQDGRSGICAPWRCSATLASLVRQLDSVASGAKASSFSLQTRGAVQDLPMGPSGSFLARTEQGSASSGVSMALQALLRTAALEMRSTGFSSTASDPNSAAVGGGHQSLRHGGEVTVHMGTGRQGASTVGDPFGSAMRGGALSYAVLRPSSTSSGPLACQIVAQPAGSLNNLVALPLDVDAVLQPGFVEVQVLHYFCL